MRKGVVEETTFLGGMIVLSAVSTKGDELEVEQPNLVWTSFCPLPIPWYLVAFVDARGPSQQLRATSAFGSELWQRLSCVSDLRTKSFVLY